MVISKINKKKANIHAEMNGIELGQVNNFKLSRADISQNGKCGQETMTRSHS